MFKTNDIAKIKINGRPRKVRVVDIVGDDAMVQHRSGSVSIIDVKELKPLLEGCVSKAQERRLRAQLKINKEIKPGGDWFFESQ
jgi:hypothetical protein